MTERTERIEAAVDTEWRTTAEIVERAGYSEDPRARSCAVQRLGALRKQGRVEMKFPADDSSSRNRALWRLKE